MKLKDLGEIDTEVVLFGGPYSNLHATRALLDEVARLDAKAICTGDVVAYGADPSATLAAIRGAEIDVIAGNCEQQLGSEARHCGCGFDAGSTCDRLSAAWYAYADERISAEDRDWMRDLPDFACFTQAGRRFAVLHGGATDVSRFLWSTSPEADFAQEVEALQRHLGDIDGVIAGHSGIGFIREVAGVTWINAGVIGMPGHDGRRSTQYATMRGGVPVLHDLTYDAEGAFASMQTAGLIQGYHTGLLSGYWPSEDVLPPELRRVSVANG